jgi:hypothetical protein
MCRRNGVRHGQLGASPCKARASSRRWHVVVQVLVRSGQALGAGLDGVRAHGKALPALDALGG